MVKTLYYCGLAIVFVMAGLSAIMFYGQGFATWCWQVLTMFYVAKTFVLSYKLDKLDTND